MSLDGLRDAYSREKKNEIANCERSLKRKLRELYSCTSLLRADRPLQAHDFRITDEPGDDERRFLDENDITKGRRFKDFTLPNPFQNPSDASLPDTLPFPLSGKPAIPPFPNVSQLSTVGTPTTIEEQLRAASASPSVATQPLPSVEIPPRNVEPAPKLPSKSPPVGSNAQPVSVINVPSREEEEVSGFGGVAPQPVRAPTSEVRGGQDESVQTQPIPDEQSVDPKDAIAPTADDAAWLPDASREQDRPKRPQVVHLPPQKVQEARLKETERNLEKAREKERKEDERLAPADVVSSPSSTVGPYSQATPRAPHHSPDTSPDTESFRGVVAASVADAIGPELAAEKAREDHEHALQAQLREARERARGNSSPTPDVERQLEAEQALREARDGKARLNEPDPPSGSRVLTEHADEVAHGARSEAPIQEVKSPLPTLAADSLPTPTMTAPELSSLDSEKVTQPKPQQVPPATIDHPTPPADADVDMDDVPTQAQEGDQASSPSPTHPSEHMTARVVSDVVRQKPAADIVNEKPATKSILTPRSSNLSATSTPTRPQSQHRKGKEISTVIFAKKDAKRTTRALQLYSDDYASLQGASHDQNRDYLEGLFKFQAHHPPRSQPLAELVASARKTVSTAGTLAMIRENHDYKILKRVYQLQNANRWSLRQISKSAEPQRPVSHLDHLLKDMKWMQTDFREERKWKKALAATFAEWCAEYVNSSAEERIQLRIRARIPKQVTASTADEDMNDAPTPDLIHSGANETESESYADDEEILSPLQSNPPAGLFSLGFNDVVMKINLTPAADTMLRELPFYDPVLDGASDITPMSFCDPPILPVSKFVTGKLVSKVRGPPKKRSRFEYDSEDEPSTPPSRLGTSAEHSMPSTPGRRLFHRNDLPPEMTDVALFNPDNKHVRDRLQAAHQFRPPTEFLMPTVSFFESRNSSQWLWEEDQKLRSLVKEFTFNWSLVAQELSLPSNFVSASGRRTPWECFERWVQLEGLPAEMSKTPYFRTYQTRLEQAQRTVAAQHQAQQQMLQQQAQQGQTVAGQMRRRTTQPVRVERRRDNRHLSIIDAMRKLARKRESAQHKQAEAAKAAALRKAHEPAPPKSNVHTPQEWSRVKAERDQKLREKMQMQQQEMHMRAMAAAAQRQGGMQGQTGMPNGVNPQQRNGTPANGSNVPTSMGNPAIPQGLSTPNGNIPAAHQNPRHQAMQGNFGNGNMNGMSMNNSGVPQAQMQATMQNSQRMPPPDQVRMGMQRSTYPNNNQQQYQLQQQQINMASSLTASMNMGNGMPNGNMIANMGGQNMNGNMNMQMNGMNGMTGMSNAGSPRMSQPQMQSPARPTPHLVQLQNNIKAQHPDWSAEQCQKAASEHLNRFVAKQRAQAMNAAAGAGMAASPQIGNNVYLQNGSMQNSPSPNAVQNYQNTLLQQQRMMQRQQAGSPGMPQARPGSRSATPQNPQMGMQSPGGQHQQAQVARGQ